MSTTLERRKRGQVESPCVCVLVCALLHKEMHMYVCMYVLCMYVYTCMYVCIMYAYMYEIYHWGDVDEYNSIYIFIYSVCNVSCIIYAYIKIHIHIHIHMHIDIIDMPL